jgi:hypothetical protein
MSIVISGHPAARWSRRPLCARQPVCTRSCWSEASKGATALMALLELERSGAEQADRRYSAIEMSYQSR